MASRPVFMPVVEQGIPKVKTKLVEFEWFPGMAISQKQKSIQSLHQAFGEEHCLEISTKSEQSLGCQLSAFNLSIKTKSGKKIPLESAFQSAKVFAEGGPFTDIQNLSAKEAKREPRLTDSGELIAFEFNNKRFPLIPRTYFYDWLYINTLFQYPDLVAQVKSYDAFTDIEFNPKKSVNCQAYSCALLVALLRAGKLENALASKESFLQIVEYGREDDEQTQQSQGSLL